MNNKFADRTSYIMLAGGIYTSLVSLLHTLGSSMVTPYDGFEVGMTFYLGIMSATLILAIHAVFAIVKFLTKKKSTYVYPYVVMMDTSSMDILSDNDTTLFAVVDVDIF